MRIKKHLLFIIPISIISTLILSFAVLFIIAICRPDTTQLAKDEFSKYYNGKNEVVLVLEHTLYFEKYEINLNRLKENEEANNGLIMKNDKFYFSTSKPNSMFNFTLNIYESDLSGAKVELVFSKDNYKTHPWVYGTNDIFYIEYYSDNALNKDSKQIDRFIIDSNKYENVASGKDCSLSDYGEEEKSNYSVEIKKDSSSTESGKFVITDLTTGEKKTIDDNYLRNTAYFESMERFNHSPERADISNGHVLLTYSIGAGNGWNFSYLIFEYDFNANTLEYKMLVFPYDSIPIEIIYLDS